MPHLHVPAGFGPKAHSLACDTPLELRQDHIGTGEAARPRSSCAPRRLDRPIECGLDRRRIPTEVVTAETETGFQTQAVAGTQADELHRGVAEQTFSDVPGDGRRYRHLEAILARIPGT